MPFYRFLFRAYSNLSTGGPGENIVSQFGLLLRKKHFYPNGAFLWPHLIEAVCRFVWLEGMGANDTGVTPDLVRETDLVRESTNLPKLEAASWIPTHSRVFRKVLGQLKVIFPVGVMRRKSGGPLR